MIQTASYAIIFGLTSNIITPALDANDDKKVLLPFSFLLIQRLQAK
jgi:hypothetical protein